MMTLPIYIIHLVVLPFVFMGMVRRGKARLQGRQGAPLLQPFFDVIKQLRKTETISDTTTLVFRTAPLVQVACVGAAALMVPWIGIDAPIAGDLFLVVYILALGKFAVSLSALDTGSAFGGLGASREATVSVQAEPAIVLSFVALASHAHSTRFSDMLAPGAHGVLTHTLVPTLVVALVLAALAELARMPVDDPTTHLELTMIHETLLLESSGPRLALLEYAAALKTVLLTGLIAQVTLLALPPWPPAIAWLLTLALISVQAVLLVIAETTLVKLGWRRIPNFLSFALAAATLGCLLVALKG